MMRRVVVRVWSFALVAVCVIVDLCSRLLGLA